MSEEMKACPFHGEGNFTNCGCLDFLEMSMDDWNTRPIEDTLRTRVDELEAERKQIADNLSNPNDIVVIANNLRTMRLLSENANLQSELIRLREQVRWRDPAKGELPEDDRKVLAIDSDPEHPVIVCYHKESVDNEESWFSFEQMRYYRGKEFDRIVKSLPEPPKEEE